MSEVTGRLMLKNVRIAYVEGLWEMKKYDEGSKPKYVATFLIPKDHPDVKKIKEVMLAVAENEWSGKGAKMLAALLNNGTTCLRDGDTKSDNPKFFNNYYINARSSTPPVVLDQNKQPISELSGLLYSGCYVNASLQLWAQSNKKFPPRINAILRGVQLVKQGEALYSGGPASIDEFDVIESSNDDLESLLGN